MENKLRQEPHNSGEDQLGAHNTLREKVQPVPRESQMTVQRNRWIL